MGRCLTWKVPHLIQDLVVAGVPNNTVEAEEDALAELLRLVFQLHSR